MKTKKQTVCPGCSRHCTQDAPRCKYGRTYFEKLDQKTTRKAALPHTEPAQGCKRKWEKLVAADGLLFHLLAASCMIKKALRSGRLSEALLMEQLTEDDRNQLAEILARLNNILNEAAKKSGEA